MTEKTACATCSLALWEKTTAGRLHPSGRGKCLWRGRVAAPFWAAREAKEIEDAASYAGGRTIWRSDIEECPTHIPA